MISKTLRYVGNDIWINADGLRTDRHGTPVSGSGASEDAAGNYAGSEPTYTPTGTFAQAVDTSTERVWLWYSGAWH